MKEDNNNNGNADDREELKYASARVCVGVCCSAPTFLEFYKKVLVSLGRSVNGSAVNDVPLMMCRLFCLLKEILVVIPLRRSTRAMIFLSTNACRNQSVSHLRRVIKSGASHRTGGKKIASL